MTHPVPRLGPIDDEPRVLGDFILGDKLGEGGFGTVYRAEQRALGRPAVVKVIRSALVANRDVAERFALEARLASRFEHPYAAHVYAFGVEPSGSMWIAMELVRGTPLDALLAQTGPLPLERLVPLMERLCDVVQAAHEQQIIHRDIKPSNVMVIARGGRLVPKLLDFGIAKTLGSDVPLTVTRPSDASTRVRSSATKLAISGDGATVSAERGSVATDATLAAVAEPTIAAASASREALASEATVAAPSADDTALSLNAPSHPSASLTRVGQILGSPPYMAPEQWADAGTVGPWTDQYALALLAYEALVGKRAIVAASLDAYRDAHATAVLPALPAHLPSGLHAVLARAAAKDPQQRYPSLVELARAFREAAFDGARIDEDPLVGLEARQRATWAAEAPRPIADAIVALGHARTAARIADRARAVAVVLARWYGVVALACQSRLGRVPSESRAHALVLAIRRRTLRDDEWLDLAAALAEPFAARPEAWPIPELASGVTSPAFTTLRQLVDERAELGADDTSVRAFAEAYVGKLAAVLDGMAWLLAYELVRVRERGLEIWRGSGEELVVRGATSTAQPGELLVLDADGAPVVRVSPLVQIARPLPEHREEVFLFAGPSRDGRVARAVTYPRGYERDDDSAWAWLATLLDVERENANLVDEQRSPYPGLAAFTTADAASYVGREQEIEEVVNRLRDQRLLAVVGPSGVGKSSFLAAGVVPAAPSWHALSMRPGAQPLLALRAAIGRCEAPYRDSAPAELALDAHALAMALVATAQRQGAVLLVVDQAEELFTMCKDEAARETFAGALVEATSHERVRVVLSLRDDFLYRVDELAAWRGVLARSVQVLRVLGPRELERAITTPAQRCGYDFDDATLPSTIVAEVAEQPGALPLVAFAAAELWQRRDRHFKRLTRAAYDEIGGVTGALVQHADGVLDRMPATERRLVRLAFRRLLTSEGTRAAVGREELATALGTDGERVIERLLASRLLVSRDDDGGERVEIVHETLATSWPRLAAWRHEDAAATKMQERLTAAARHWHERGRPAALLWRGAILDDVEQLVAGGHSRNELEDTFVTASRRASRRRRRVTIAIVASAFGILAAGTTVLALTNREVKAQKRSAVERLAASFAQQGRLAAGANDAPRAALFLTESRRLGASGTGADLLIAHAAAALESHVETLGHSDVPIWRAHFASDGVLAVGSGKTLRRWSAGKAVTFGERMKDGAEAGDTVVALDDRGALAAFAKDGKPRWRVDGAQPSPLGIEAHPSGAIVTYGMGAKLWSLGDGARRVELAASRINAAAFDAAGSRVALGGADGSVTVYEVATGRSLATCTSHEMRVGLARFTPDGSSLVTGGWGPEVLVCDPATGALRHRLVGHRSKVSALALSRDGRFAVSAARDGSVVVWDLQTGAARAQRSLGASVRQVELSPDGNVLATATRDGSVQLWDIESGAALGSLHGHESAVTEIRWQGAHVVTTSMDGSIRRWELARALRAVTAHGAPLVALDVAGELAASASSQPHVTISELTTRRSVTLDHDRPITAVRIAPDRRTVATLDDRGAVSVWSIADRRRVATVGEGLATLAYLPDGTLVTAAANGHVRWWSADGQATGHLELATTTASLAVDPAGRWLVAAPDLVTGGFVTIVDLATRTAVTKLSAGGRTRVAVSSDRLAISRDGVIELVELGTWRSIAKLVGHDGALNTLRFLPDGRLLSAAIEGRLLAWSRDGQLLRGLDAGGDITMHVDVSTDGALIAAIGYDGTLRVFDATTLDRLLSVPGHRSVPFFLRFVDGAIVAATNEGHVLRWDVRHPTRSLAQLTELVRCRVPLRLEGDLAVPRPLDLSDPSCR